MDTPLYQCDALGRQLGCTVSFVRRVRRAEFAALLADAERPLQLMELPYRVVDLAAGDLTFSSARIFDLEVYAPGVDRWLEVSSVGNFTDFQARRGNIRFRSESGKNRQTLLPQRIRAGHTPDVGSHH